MENRLKAGQFLSRKHSVPPCREDIMLLILPRIKSSRVKTLSCKPGTGKRSGYLNVYISRTITAKGSEIFWLFLKICWLEKRGWKKIYSVKRKWQTNFEHLLTCGTPPSPQPQKFKLKCPVWMRFNRRPFMSSVYLVLVVHHNPGILKWTSALSEIKPKIPSKTVIM